MGDEFHVSVLPNQLITFEEFRDVVNFEQIMKGRKGANLGLPNTLFRTTTKYKSPMQPFHAIHSELMDAISAEMNIDVEFNSALVEIYNSQYTTMGFHSDQMLDMADDSWICIFSIYREPPSIPRTLVTKNKKTGECASIPLIQNSIVFFSMETNRNYLHKIILEGSGPSEKENEWLCFTFRTSKTKIEYHQHIPYIRKEDATRVKLRMATNEDEKHMYRLRMEENMKTVDFTYPFLDFTISEGDVIVASHP